MADAAIESPKKSVITHKAMFNVLILRKALLPFKEVITSNSVLAILEDVCVEIKNGIATFSGTDLETLISIDIAVQQPTTDFSFCASYNKLYGFIKDADPDQGTDFTIEYTPSAGFIYIKHGVFRAKLLVEEAASFPKTPDIANKKHMVLPSEDIVPLLKNCLIFISHDELRPAMTGVYMHSADDGLRIVSTDAHRLYYKVVTPKVPKGMADCSVIMNQKMVKLATILFKGKENISFKFDENGMFITGDRYRIYGRLIDARYPDYKVVIPEMGTHFFVKRKQMIALLKVAWHFINRSNNQINLYVSKDHIDYRGGDVDFDFDFQYKAPLYNPNVPDMSFKFALNAKFLYEGISFHKEELIKISTNMSATQAYILDDCILLMPLMLNQ